MKIKILLAVATIAAGCSTTNAAPVQGPATAEDSAPSASVQARQTQSRPKLVYEPMPSTPPKVYAFEEEKPYSAKFITPGTELLWRSEGENRGYDYFPCIREDGSWWLGVNGFRNRGEGHFYTILDASEVRELVPNRKGRLPVPMDLDTFACQRETSLTEGRFFDFETGEIYEGSRYGWTDVLPRARWFTNVNGRKQLRDVDGNLFELPRDFSSCNSLFEDESRLTLACATRSEERAKQLVSWSPATRTLRAVSPFAKSDILPLKRVGKRARLLYQYHVRLYLDRATLRQYESPERGEFAFYDINRARKHRATLGLFEEGDSVELRYYDLDSGTYISVASFESNECPGRLGPGHTRIQMGARFATVVCAQDNKKYPKHYWSQVFDLDRETTWRTELSIDRVASDGTVFLSDTRVWSPWSPFRSIFRANLR